MRIEVLVCTINERIVDVPQLFIAPRDDVGYVVSMQYTDERYLDMIPDVIRNRKDVRLVLLEGKGLCRNRNNALKAATAEIALIADDNVHYCDEYFDNVFKVFNENKNVDIAQFKVKSAYYEGIPNRYPTHSCTYPNVARGMFVTSIEMALRVSTVRGKVWFDERFGLGSPYFNCGEESVFVHNAVQAGLTVTYFPLYAVEHDVPGTGSNVYTDERVMMAMGAAQYLINGSSAYLRMLKWALVNALKGKCSFLKVIRGTFKGINYYRKVVQYESPIGR